MGCIKRCGTFIAIVVALVAVLIGSFFTELPRKVGVFDYLDNLQDARYSTHSATILLLTVRHYAKQCNIMLPIKTCFYPHDIQWELTFERNFTFVEP